MTIEVRRRYGGAWCVYIDGEFVSDHATHVAARRAAAQHASMDSSEHLHVAERAPAVHIEPEETQP
jgi:hypothetical protein